MDKILTISIAAYNVEKFLRSTLNSLCEQTVIEDLEIFVVDDGSTDETLCIAQEYEKKFPDSFFAVHKENGGYGSTVNYSIAHATGKYFKLLDGDDWFCKENLNAFIQFLKNQDADIVLSPYYQVLTGIGEKNLIDDNRCIDGLKKMENASIKSSLLMHEMAVKTEVLQKQRKQITEHCFYTDNEYLYMALLNSKTITRFDLPVYCYQIGVEGQSVSVEGIRKHYTDKSKVACKIYKWYEEVNIDSYTGYHKEILNQKILGLTDGTYSAYMTLENSKKGKKELIKFDKKIKKEFPEIYRLTMSVKKIKLFRASKYSAFAYLRKKYLKSFEV